MLLLWEWQELRSTIIEWVVCVGSWQRARLLLFVVLLTLPLLLLFLLLLLLRLRPCWSSLQR